MKHLCTDSTEFQQIMLTKHSMTDNVKILQKILELSKDNFRVNSIKS